MVQKMDFTQMTSNMNYQSFLDALNAFKGWFGGLELIFQILVIVALVAATVGVLGTYWLHYQRYFLADRANNQIVRGDL